MVEEGQEGEEANAVSVWAKNTQGQIGLSSGGGRIWYHLIQPHGLWVQEGKGCQELAVDTEVEPTASSLSSPFSSPPIFLFSLLSNPFCLSIFFITYVLLQ